jgi:hypothetical protein
MIIVFPYFINDFFSLLEFPLFYRFSNKDYLNTFNLYIDIYLNNISNFVDSIYEDYRFLKVTLDLEYLKDQNKIYYSSILKLDELISKNALNNTLSEINQNSNLLKNLINNLNTEKYDVIQKELSSYIKKILKDTVELIDFSNNINKILNIQKKISFYPFIDKFLKMYLVYVQNIQNLSDYPVDILLNLLLKNVSFISNLDKNYYYIIDILEKNLKTQNLEDTKLNTLLNHYKDLFNFIEAIKYALGGVYQIITGNIEELNKKEVELLFIQINQASNGLYQKQIEIKSFITNNFETPFDLYLLYFKYLLNNYQETKEEIIKLIFGEFNNFLLSFFTNPLVYYNFNEESIKIYEKILFYIDNYFLIDIKDIDSIKLNQIIEVIKYFKNLYIKKDFLNIENQETLKNIFEILTMYSLFINHNITYTTFLNLLKNIFSFVNTYKVFSLNNILNDNDLNLIKSLEDKFNYISDLINYENTFYNFYVNYYNSKVDYYKFTLELSYIIYDVIYLLKNLLISFNEIINTKHKCPKCFSDNEYLNLRCNNCDFRFPFNPLKFLLNTLINANPLIWSYTLNLIDSIFYKKDKELALDFIYNSIDNFSNFLNNIDPLNLQNEELKSNYFIIEKIVKILQELYETIESKVNDLDNLGDYYEEIILKISEIVGISKDLKLN